MIDEQWFPNNGYCWMEFYGNMYDWTATGGSGSICIPGKEQNSLVKNPVTLETFFKLLLISTSVSAL